MTNAEYEEAYREALLSIPGADIGQPYERDGKRVVAINGAEFSDERVFEKAWGIKVSAQINQERQIVYDQRQPRLA